MDSVQRRTYVMAELKRLGVAIEKLPSGNTRLSNRYGFLTTVDVIHLTESDLKTFAGRGF